MKNRCSPSSHSGETDRPYVTCFNYRSVTTLTTPAEVLIGTEDSNLNYLIERATYLYQLDIIYCA